MRRWRLFERTIKTIAQQEITENVLPSIPLMTWAILRRPELDGQPFEEQLFLDGLRARFASTTTSDPGAHGACHNDDTWILISHAPDQTICLSQSPGGIAQRVPYIFPDVSEGTRFSTIYVDGEPRPLFDRYPPRTLFPDSDPHGLGTSTMKRLKDSIVIIGSSYKDSRDLHMTPIGMVPGALWVSNAIEGVMEYGQYSDAPAWLRWTEQVLLLGLISVIFATFHSSIKAPLAIGIVLILVFIPFSIWLFKLGSWLDFALPVAGVFTHRLIEQIEQELNRQPSEAH